MRQVVLPILLLVEETEPRKVEMSYLPTQKSSYRSGKNQDLCSLHQLTDNISYQTQSTVIHGISHMEQLFLKIRYYLNVVFTRLKIIDHFLWQSTTVFTKRTN